MQQSGGDVPEVCGKKVGMVLECAKMKWGQWSVQVRGGEGVGVCWDKVRTELACAETRWRPADKTDTHSFNPQSLLFMDHSHTNPAIDLLPWINTHCANKADNLAAVCGHTPETLNLAACLL